MVLWIVMASAVTQLNTNGGQAVKANEDKIAELQNELTKAKEDLYSLRTNLTLVQEQADVSRTYVRMQLSKTEKRQADIVEALERIKVQVTLAEKAVQLAVVNKDQRTKDVADLETEKAKLLTTVDTLKGDDSVLREQRETLLTNLKSMLAENKKLVERAAKPAASAVQ